MKRYLFNTISGLIMILVVASCKKDKTVTPPPVTSLITLGLYQYQSGNYKRIFIPITKVGTQTVNYYGTFDTGSSGMTIDAAGILPAAMITANGIQVTGDSVNVNGITVTSKTSIMSYGDKTSLTKQYGNLAYAQVTLGDVNGNITTKRIPFFLYYKVINSNTGSVYPAHSADIFGVSPGTSFAFTQIASPLSYFDLSPSLAQGFRLALLNSNSFTTSGSYVAGLLSIGLTPADRAASAGFIMHPLSPASNGYSPNIPGTITYNGTTTAAQFLFDTGNPSVTIIENTKETQSIGDLPVNSVVTLTTNRGFTYSYTTTNTANLTTIQNPNNTADFRTIFSIDFFIKNEYLTDYTNHQIGLKNN